MIMNNKQIISDIRRYAKSYGLVFKQSKTRMNGVLLWQLNDRASGDVVISNYRVATAYEDCMSGYMSTYNRSTRQFEGLNN